MADLSAVHLGADGSGAISLTWAEALDELRAVAARRAAAAVGRAVDVVGLRFVGPDGREGDAPIDGGVILIGFEPAP